MASLTPLQAVRTQDPSLPPADMGVLDERSSHRCGHHTNVYYGQWRGQPARFKEYRLIHPGIDTLIDEALFRRHYQIPSHVPMMGVYQTSPALGSRIYLVDAQRNYTTLKSYLELSPNADPAYFRMGLHPTHCLEIVADLHPKGLVLWTIRLQSFVVDSSGTLLLSAFGMMRVEDPCAAFCHVSSPCLDAMMCMAPELLQSLRSDGHAGITKATDVYAVGCFAYKLFLGGSPFAERYRGYPTHMAQFQLINDIVDGVERPKMPSVETYPLHGLTNEIWSILERCLSNNPSGRPLVPKIIACITLA
ncbi:kinase-like protein [Coprinellus micaceus]|uniref:Kinase-like protein n=1 Tax=Coprinellus micaceus TaxID=71717 RepID=A0A4Y7SV52_COPMI|nr:kinase-like protein [Coprinellus micaceus]